jgi:hypothetical protein
MQLPDRKFEDTQAKREKVPLIAAIYGKSGSGKTMSALELATGMQEVYGGDIGYIDTEAKRALHYADWYKFRHLPFEAPYGPLHYLRAFEHLYSKGVRVFIADSMSHEHTGVGGVLDMHDEEVQKMAGNDTDKAKRVNGLAWTKPKMERRRLVDFIVHMADACIVLAFRAENKLNWNTGREPEKLGDMPVGAEAFVYEATIRLYLPVGAAGVPDLEPKFPGEREMVRVPLQFTALFEGDSRPIDRALGKSLAEWSAGGAARVSDQPRKAAAQSTGTVSPAGEERRAGLVKEILRLGGVLKWSTEQRRKWLTDTFGSSDGKVLTVQQLSDAVALLGVKAAGNEADYDAELETMRELGRAA